MGTDNSQVTTVFSSELVHCDRVGQRSGVGIMGADNSQVTTVVSSELLHCDRVGQRSGAGIMGADNSQVTTVFTVQLIGTRQTEYHEALPSSANNEARCDCTFSHDGNAS